MSLRPVDSRALGKLTRPDFCLSLSLQSLNKTSGFTFSCVARREKTVKLRSRSSQCQINKGVSF